MINIFLFYLCLGVSKGSLSRMLLVSGNGGGGPVGPIQGHRSSGDVVDAEGPDAVGTVGADAEVPGPEGPVGAEMLEVLSEAANAKVVPFYELVAFTNQPFPEMMKKLRQTLVRSLWINEQAYVMVRFFNLMLNLDWDGIEIVLQRFGTPAIEWAGAIRSNLRDFRSAWLLWSMHSEANQLVQRQKNQVKNRQRLERKRQATKTANNDNNVDDNDEAVVDDKPKKKTTATRKRTKAPTTATTVAKAPDSDPPLSGQDGAESKKAKIESAQN